MASEKTTPHYDLLLRAYEKATAKVERAKTEETAAKHYFKNAPKNTEKIMLQILELDYKKAKHKKKAAKAGEEIAKLRLKSWEKTHQDEIKTYQLATPIAGEKEDGVTKTEIVKVEKEKKSEHKDVKAAEKKSEIKVDKKSEKKVEKKSEKKSEKPSDKKMAEKTVKKSDNKPIEEAKSEKPAAKETVTVKNIETPKVVRPAATPIVEKSIPVVTKVYKIDNFTPIEGIGPKINEILHNNGIYSFSQLASTEVNKLKSILLTAGNRLADPTTWGEQAALIAANKMTELKALQDKLKGGKVVK
jgi:predicted flap endonuclease-1-like 5' DNA nuclease